METVDTQVKRLDYFSNLVIAQDQKRKNQMYADGGMKNMSTIYFKIAKSLQDDFLANLKGPELSQADLSAIDSMFMELLGIGYYIYYTDITTLKNESIINIDKQNELKKVNGIYTNDLVETVIGKWVEYIAVGSKDADSIVPSYVVQVITKKAAWFFNEIEKSQNWAINLSDDKKKELLMKMIWLMISGYVCCVFAQEQNS